MVQESQDLTGQSVLLEVPTENIYLNVPVTIFNWEKISAADSYEFTLIKKTSGEQVVFQDNNVTSNSISIDALLIDEDAEYIWKVKAVNTSSETAFSERSFFIDTVIPSQPTLTTPDDETTVEPSTITFNWTNGADTGAIKSSITNTLEIATDANFNSILHAEETVNNSVQYEFTNTNTYYWRVRAIDAATNQSDYSIIRSIIVE